MNNEQTQGLVREFLCKNIEITACDDLHKPIDLYDVGADELLFTFRLFKSARQAVVGTSLFQRQQNKSVIWEKLVSSESVPNICLLPTYPPALRFGR